jgi:CheY-like chemotaxis protein
MGAEQGCTVILVDDDTSVLAAVGAFLRSCGFAVVRQRGAEGLGRTMMNVRPNVIVLDLHMPETDGTTAAANIRTLLRADPALSNIPVVFYSSADVGELRSVSAQVPNSSYVSKSEPLRALQRAILRAAL